MPARAAARDRSGVCVYVATNGNDGNAGTVDRTAAHHPEGRRPGPARHTISVRGGTYAPSTNIQLLKNGTASQPITCATTTTSEWSSTARTCRTRPAPVGSSIPRADRGADPHRGRPLAAHRPGDHPRAVRHLRRGHQQHRLRPARHQGQLRVRAAHPGLRRATTRSSTSTATATATRARTARARTAWRSRKAPARGNVVRGARLWNNSDDGLDFWMFSSPILVENSLAVGQRLQPLEPARTSPATATASSSAATAWRPTTPCATA